MKTQTKEEVERKQEGAKAKQKEKRKKKKKKKKPFNTPEIFRKEIGEGIHLALWTPRHLLNILSDEP